jgi:hypothetical protein
MALGAKQYDEGWVIDCSLSLGNSVTKSNLHHDLKILQ